MSKPWLHAAMAALCIGGSHSALAGAILSPVSVVSNDMGEFAVGDILTVNNQSGLSASFASGLTDFVTYMAGAPTHTSLYSGFEWFSAPDKTSGTLVLDLGAIYSVGNIALWNEEFSGIASMDVKFSETTDFGGSPSAGTVFPTNNPQNADYFAQVFGVGASMGRYVELALSCPNPDFLYNGCSMGEIAFDVSAAVPEPSTYALMLAGLALVAGVARRPRCSKAATT